jgi:hypothetical protein
MILAVPGHLPRACRSDRNAQPFRYTTIMAKVVDPGTLPDANIRIPGLKPGVLEFLPSDDSDPSEVGAFNRMIRELRKGNAAPRSDPK